jgi:hypothetical protein
MVVVLAFGYSPRSYESIGDERARRSWERISSFSELISEHGDHGWKALEEKNGIETPNGGFVFSRRTQFLRPIMGVLQIGIKA